MKTLLLMGCAAVLTGCQSLQTTSTPVVFAGGDGSSCEQAVVIKNAEFRETGMVAERVWLDKRYPDCRQTQQSELDLGGRHYDLVELTTPDHRTAKVYFDSTDWFTK